MSSARKIRRKIRLPEDAITRGLPALPSTLRKAIVKRVSSELANFSPSPDPVGSEHGIDWTPDKTPPCRTGGIVLVMRRMGDPAKAQACA
jgi:hypothetical protein